MKVQRLRVTFSRGDRIKFITHLDLMRAWERALRRAGIDIAYSEGFTPHPRLSLAAPLAVGVTGVAEVLDVFLNSRVDLRAFVRDVSQQLPEGLAISEVREVGLRAPSVQSEVRWAEYRASLGPEVRPETAQERIDSFLAAASVPWEHLREKEARRYDIRALVDSLWLENGDWPVIGMRLRADGGGSGRPEQVVAALGLPEPLKIERTKLIMAGTSPAHEAWRREGRFT